MRRRLFTVEEANAALPELVPLLEWLRDAQTRISEAHAAVQAAVPRNGGGRQGRELLETSGEAAAAVGRIDEMGVLLRDVSTGLIDFPAEREGREVYLCFKLGEDRIEWWHPPETGIAGRQPL